MHSPLFSRPADARGSGLTFPLSSATGAFRSSAECISSLQLTLSRHRRPVGVRHQTTRKPPCKTCYLSGFCIADTTLASTSTPPAATRPIERLWVASVMAPAATGPIVCPMANKVVKIATDRPQLASGRFFRPNAVADVGQMGNDRPKIDADRSKPMMPGTNSGSSVPIPVARQASASASPPFDRAKIGRHGNGDSITAMPSALHVAATQAGAIPFERASTQRETLCRQCTRQRRENNRPVRKSCDQLAGLTVCLMLRSALRQVQHVPPKWRARSRCLKRQP